MFKNGQIVNANEIFEKGWIIDSHSEINHSTTYISLDGKQIAIITDENSTKAIIENI